MNPDLPTGTVTFLFSDIQDSTRLWEQFPQAMQPALASHDALLKDAITSNLGHVVKTTGDGAMAVFTTAQDGLNAAIAAQRGLQAVTQEPHIHVRMSLHTAEAELRAGDYYGQAVNRAARLMSVGHGGQVLLSGTTAQVLRDQLPEGASLLDLGEHALKGLSRPEQIFQLVLPDLPGEFPPLASSQTTSNNLPVQLTSFIGREKEITETKALLNSARLVTLTGTGGTGKTRLSIEVGTQELERFPDGVWMVELATLSDPAQILPTLAHVLGLRESSFSPLATLVTQNLHSKTLLLILDNCEHLVAACARLADDLLRTCTRLKLLTNSREALGIAGEMVYRIPSLAETESTRLFVERARAANAHFKLTDANAAAIAQVCSHLDGIPLAIELAAARTRLLSPDQIAAHLDDRFKLLTGGSRTALPRQQTLRALIDWGYDLLSPEECALLRRLSVFSGGWTYPAAEFICPDQDVLDLLEQLVNKSLVVVDELEDGSMRYHLLETIRQYALQKLQETGEQDEAHERHASYFLQLSKEVEPRLYTQVTGELVNSLERELDNFQAALEWLMDHDIDSALQIMYSLQLLWIMNTNQSRGKTLAQMVIERAEEKPLREGETPRQRKLMIARAMSSLIAGQLSLGETHHIPELAAKCAGYALEGGDMGLAARALAYQCIGSLSVGETRGIDEVARQALAYARESGDQFVLGLSLGVTGEYMLTTGEDPEQAHAYAREGIAILEKAGFKWYLALIMLGIGIAAKYRGDYQTARENLQKVLPLFQEMGDSQPVAMIRSEFAHMDRYEGRLDQAEAAYRQTLPAWQKLGQQAAVANQLETLAFIAIAHSQNERAARLLGAAEALREKIDIPMSHFEQVEYDRQVQTLRQSMEAGAFSELWSQGRHLGIDRAVQAALEQG